MDSIKRPTSRVLAPPGGGSSNIFGGESEPVKALNPNDPRHQTNNIFGESEPAKKPERKNTPNAEQNVPPMQNQSEVNPTGAPGLKRPSTKVHAPPGGHSSISFG